MAGGMAQTETFDPKRYTPFEPGVPVEKVLSTFPSIPTAVDNIKFTKGLEQIGSVIDKGTVIRTFMAADLGFILHSRPVSLAYRLHPTAADGDAASRGGDIENARAEES
jgi:hypothetical protein